MNPKVLLHICCAPCAIEIVDFFHDKDLYVKGYFYNPNIHPQKEHERRKQTLKDYSTRAGVPVDYPKYDIKDYFKKILGKDGSEEKPKRCEICWRLRLEKCAQEAAKKDYDYFSTTLLISPYQDQNKLWDIGKEIEKKNGIGFYYHDFRPFFRSGQQKAREMNLYRQRYCGCKYSFLENSQV